MITLPSSSKGFYSCWDAYSRVASPASSYSLSPPVSPPGSPSRILTLLSPPKSRPASPLPSPLHAISEVFTQRTSWPVYPLPLSERQISESESRSSVITTSVSYAYSVKSINSRKSRLTVRYPRPDRPHVHVESIIESAGASASLESLSPLSSRPVSMSQGNLVSIAENEHVADAMETLSILFDSSPGDHSPVERRLSASWESLLKIKDYEEVCPLSSAASETRSWLYRNRSMSRPSYERLGSLLTPSSVCITRLLKCSPSVYKN